MIVADMSGTGTATIEPSLKVAISGSTSASISGTAAVMRMDSNDLGWDADHVSKYGFSFSCTEALMKLSDAILSPSRCNYDCNSLVLLARF